MTFSLLCEAFSRRVRTAIVEPHQVLALKPNDPEPDAKASQTPKWCRLRGSCDDSRQVSSGGPGARRFRTTGSFMIEFAVPVKSGDAAVNELVDIAVTAFRMHRFTAPKTRFEPAPYAVGDAVTGVDGWCRRTVRAPFIMDEIL